MNTAVDRAEIKIKTHTMTPKPTLNYKGVTGKIGRFLKRYSPHLISILAVINVGKTALSYLGYISTGLSLLIACVISTVTILAAWTVIKFYVEVAAQTTTATTASAEATATTRTDE